MLDFQQKRKVRGLMYSRITLGVLGLIVLLFLHSTWSVYKKKVESEQMKIATEQRVSELRYRDQDLKDKIARLDTDSGIEAEIRSKFSVAKENETMVVVVSDEVDKSSTTTQKLGFWQRFGRWFAD